MHEEVPKFMGKGKSRPYSTIAGALVDILSKPDEVTIWAG